MSVFFLLIIIYLTSQANVGIKVADMIRINVFEFLL